MKAGDAVQFYAIDRASSIAEGGVVSSAGRAVRAGVVVIKPGMLTTIQDAGRWGLQSRGVPVAGPMDPVSHRAGQRARRQ